VANQQAGFLGIEKIDKLKIALAELVAEEPWLVRG
jgi:hypothetical protein